MDNSWGSFHQTILMILVINFTLFSSCFLVANSTNIPKQVQQIVQDSATVLDQAATTLSNATESLLATASGSLEDQAFLAAHNKARLHAGEPLLAWDSKLASYARQYAQKRSADCQLIHSNGPYGENIFWGGGSQWRPEDAVALWVKEHRFYNRNTMNCAEGKMCGHYTQVVWRDSSRIGCAMGQCRNGDTFAVCSYDPPGNYVGENPFQDNNNGK